MRRTLALAVLLPLSLSACGESEESTPKPEPLTTATGSPLVGGLESGEVTGRLVRAAEDGTTRPVQGEVTFNAEDGSVARTQVDSGGEFRIQLAPGRYRLMGATPELPEVQCATDPPTTVLEKGSVVIVDIVCPAG